MLADASGSPAFSFDVERPGLTLPAKYLKNAGL
jgi:hypothetical protein